MAEALADAQVKKIAAIITQLVARLPQPPHTVVVSGQGDFLARRVLEKAKIKANLVALARELGPELSQCAPAHALAVLAREGPKQ